MNLLQYIGTVEIALVYMFVVLGVYITFRVLHFPDLTVDGTFTLGGALSAMITLHFHAPGASLVGAFIGGMLLGSVTAILHTRFKILPLMAGIIVMTGLYSINLRIMNGPNAAIIGQSTIFDRFSFLANNHTSVKILLLSVGGILLGLCLYAFLKTKVGLALRAVGDKQSCARLQGIPSKGLIILGVALSNGLVALGGALFVQTQGFADVNMGLGTIITALASLMIGKAILSRETLMVGLLSASIGTFLYRFFVAFALNVQAFHLAPADLNLITALFVALSFIYAHKKQGKSHA